MRKGNPELERLRGLAIPEDDATPLLDFYQSRTPAQEEGIAEAAMKLRRADSDVGDTLLLYLSAFGRGPGMQVVYPDLLSEGSFYPASLWRFARDEHVSAIGDHLGRNTRETDHALQALAWCRSPASIALFESWRRSPPRWSSLLHWAPHRYAVTAGWMLTSSGTVRQLYRDRCLPLRVAPAGERPAYQAWGALEEPCGFCGRPMVALLPGGADTDTVDVATCLSCTFFGPLFSRQGPKRWALENVKPKHLSTSGKWRDWPTVTLATGQARTPFAAAHCSLPVPITQVGGLPTWLQDPEYPSCACCGEPMCFIAQLDLCEIKLPGDGIHYAFRCDPCGLSATCYQQT